MWSYCTPRHGCSFGLMNEITFILPDTCQSLWLYPIWEMGKKERKEGKRGSKVHSIQTILCHTQFEVEEKSWLEDDGWTGGIETLTDDLQFLRTWCGIKNLLRKSSGKNHRQWQTTTLSWWLVLGEAVDTACVLYFTHSWSQQNESPLAKGGAEVWMLVAPPTPIHRLNPNPQGDGI